MTDIVERLRDADHVRLVAGAHWGTLCTEAADEIVRLEKAINDIIDECDNAISKDLGAWLEITPIMLIAERALGVNKL